jgi:hypothetical protein
VFGVTGEHRAVVRPPGVDVLVIAALHSGNGPDHEAGADEVKASEAAGVIEQGAEPLVVIVIA